MRGPRATAGRPRAGVSRPVRRLIGAHVPTAGGLAKAALPYLDASGAEAAQIFVSNPRGWALSPGDPAQDELFVAGCAQRGAPVYVHASLLVNLGSPTPATVEQSAATLAHAVARGTAIGARAVVFHAAVPVIVETPTVRHTGHAADIATLRRLHDAAGQTTARKRARPRRS